MRSTIRSATLIGYAELARSVGLDPNRLMRRCGLDPSCLSDPDVRIDAAAVAKLLETSAAESQVEDFGLRLSKARRLSNLGPFSLVVREEITARRAIETLGRYLQLHSELLSIRIEDAGELVMLRVDIVPGTRMPRRQGIELFVGYLFRILQELLGPSWKPRRVLFMHSPPAIQSGHIAMFGRIVDFNAEFNGIACAAEDLAGQLPSADPVMARYARQYLDSMTSRPDMTLADKVGWLVRETLPLGRCSVDKVAQHLGVDRRTVHRHLAQNGKTFSSLLDEVRSELAESYLEGSKRPCTEVADLLGFSALSAFSRWHKNHFGFTLTQRRSGK
jgi:AraC-like DNA-binding protein